MERVYSIENGSFQASDFTSTPGKYTGNTDNDSSTKIDKNQLPIRSPPNSPIIHVLALCFGVSSQAGISGLSNELPMLVNTAPEGAKLPSYFVIVMQLANVTTVVYLIATKILKRTRDSLWIFTLLCSAIVALILLALYHNVSVRVGNSHYSLVFFALVFIVGSLKSSGQVLMVPFMRHFHKTDMLSFFIGQGAGSSLIGLISLFQGDSAKECNKDDPVVVSNVNFSVRDFLFLLASLHVLSLVAFLMLQYYRVVWKNSKIDTRIESRDESDKLETPIKCTDDNDLQKVISTSDRVVYYALLATMPFFGLGFLDAITPFASLPYGNSTYRMALVFAPWSELIVCILTLWIIPLYRWLIKYIVIALLASYMYILCLALISPNIPFVNSYIGDFAIVTAHVIIASSIRYTNLVIITTFRAHEDSQALVYAGACVQLGEASGGIIAFILTNFTSIFEYQSEC